MKLTKIFGLCAVLSFIASFVFEGAALFLLFAAVWLGSFWFLGLIANGRI